MRPSLFIIFRHRQGAAVHNCPDRDFLSSSGTLDVIPTKGKVIRYQPIVPRIKAQEKRLNHFFCKNSLGRIVK